MLFKRRSQHQHPGSRSQHRGNLTVCSVSSGWSLCNSWRQSRTSFPRACWRRKLVSCTVPKKSESIRTQHGTTQLAHCLLTFGSLVEWPVTTAVHLTIITYTVITCYSSHVLLFFISSLYTICWHNEDYPSPFINCNYGRNRLALLWVRSRSWKETWYYYSLIQLNSY